MMLNKLLNRVLGKRAEPKTYQLYHTVVVMGYTEEPEIKDIVNDLIKTADGKPTTGLHGHVFAREF